MVKGKQKAIDYCDTLDLILLELRKELCSKVFFQMLNHLWVQLLHKLQKLPGKGPLIGKLWWSLQKRDRTLEFLSYLKDLFHADGEGLPLSSLTFSL